MKLKQMVGHDEIMKFVAGLYNGDLHAKRALSLANATLGVLASASLAVHAIGQGLAQAMGTLSKHGIKQVDRLLSNEGIDVGTFFGHWVGHVIAARSEVVVALDWTSFARDGHETKERMHDKLVLFGLNIIEHSDVPRRKGKRSRNIRELLYGKQAGNCNLCQQVQSSTKDTPP